MDHKSYLSIYCRLCGKRNIVEKEQEQKIIYPITDSIRKLVQILHEVNLTDESSDIFPAQVCKQCYNKYNDKSELHREIQQAEKSSDPDAVRHLSRSNAIVDFWAHNSYQCEICEDPNYEEDSGKAMVEERKKYQHLNQNVSSPSPAAVASGGLPSQILMKNVPPGGFKPGTTMKINGQTVTVLKSANGKSMAQVNDPRKRKIINIAAFPQAKNAKRARPTIRGSLAASGVTLTSEVKRRLPPQELETLKRQIHGSLPTNRISRADIVRYLLVNAMREKRSLLERVGIKFEVTGGSYLCEKGFSMHAAQVFEKKLSCLIDVQWAVIMAEVIFKLLHPRDELSLAQIGITVDPDHPKAPLVHKIQHYMRLHLKESFKDASGDTLCVYLVKQLGLKAIPPHVRAVESVLGLTEQEAEEFIHHGVKNKKRPQSRAMNGLGIATMVPLIRKLPDAQVRMLVRQGKGGRQAASNAKILQLLEQNNIQVFKPSIAKKGAAKGVAKGVAKGGGRGRPKGKAAGQKRGQTPIKKRKPRKAIKEELDYDDDDSMDFSSSTNAASTPRSGRPKRQAAPKNFSNFADPLEEEEDDNATMDPTFGDDPLDMADEGLEGEIENDNGEIDCKQHVREIIEEQNRKMEKEKEEADKKGDNPLEKAMLDAGIGEEGQTEGQGQSEEGQIDGKGQNEGQKEDKGQAEGQGQTENQTEGQGQTENQTKDQGQVETQTESQGQTENQTEGQGQTEDLKEGQGQTEDLKEGQGQTEDQTKSQGQAEEQNGNEGQNEVQDQTEDKGVNEGQSEGQGQVEEHNEIQDQTEAEEPNSETVCPLEKALEDADNNSYNQSSNEERDANQAGQDPDPIQNESNQVEQECNPLEQSSKGIDEDEAIPMEQSSDQVEPDSNPLDQSSNELDPFEESSNQAEANSNQIEQSSNRIDQSPNPIDQSANQIEQSPNPIDQSGNQIDESSNQIDESSNPIEQSNLIDQSSNPIEQSIEDQNGGSNQPEYQPETNPLESTSGTTQFEQPLEQTEESSSIMEQI